MAQDPERLARFGREAKALASLNHPNIAQIYCIEHPSPYCDGYEVVFAAGLPLGIVTGVDYSESVVAGSILTLVSDGVGGSR